MRGIGPGSLRGQWTGWLCCQVEQAGREGSGAQSWGVWLLVGLAGLCEAQLCPELRVAFATTTDVAAPAREGRWVSGTAALHSQSEAGLHWGAFYPPNPTLRGAEGGGQQWAGASAHLHCQDPALSAKAGASIPSTGRTREGSYLSPPESVRQAGGRDDSEVHSVPLLCLKR
jgi:hypothetical protein